MHLMHFVSQSETDDEMPAYRQTGNKWIRLRNPVYLD